MTRVVVGEFITGDKNPKIIGAGEARSLGVRHGYVSNPDSATISVRNALDLAEKSSGIKIKRAFVSVGGASLKSENSSGEAIISKANGEVTTLDVNRALADCEENLNLNNKKIIQMYPLSFRLDGKEVLGRPEGMRGTKLEAKALFVTYSVQHLDDLLEVIGRAGVETIDVIPAPLAVANVVLSDRQKIVGVAVVNIGSETTSLAVFENGSLISVHTFAIGSSDITNDIALGFKIPLEKAEELKLQNLADSRVGAKEEFPKKKLEEIIRARLCDIFESVENNLKKIKRVELLPAGIIFAGGGANTHKLEESSKAVLKLPSLVGTTQIFGNLRTKLRDPAWFTAIGLLMSSLENGGYAENSLMGVFKNVKNLLKASVRQLIP